MSLRDVVTRVWVPVSDRAVEDTEQSRAFLGDAFALMVAEGARRWGAPEMSQTEKQQKATWMNPDGSRTEMAFGGRLCFAKYAMAAYRADEHLHGSL